MFDILFIKVRIVDIIDIVIVAFILYRLYVVMQGTIAGQIFVGLLLILGVSFVSQALDMRLLSRVLGIVSDIWVIALVVLFQPELRRILLLIGRRGGAFTSGRNDLNLMVDEIVGAAEDLALRKFGALIVITRTSNLSFSFETGMILDSRLSQEMLVSIFNPKSPLHDGAVVVTGTEIRSARVVLPLSSTTRIGDRLLGTRHRAALGIAEQADVFVVVVSEERGSTSYAFDGQLYVDQSLDTIRLALLDAIKGTQGPSRGELFQRIAEIVARRGSDDRSRNGGRSRFRRQGRGVTSEKRK